MDKKDYQLLYQLDLNARQPNSKIAKTLKLSKDAISYRIKNLEKDNIILSYTTLIDSTKLGYNLYRIFLNLIDTPPPQLNNIIKFLQDQKNTWWIAKLDGSWNFAFAAWFKTNKEFKDFYTDFLQNFKQNIKQQLICPITAYKHYNRSYLINTRTTKKEIVAQGPKTKHDQIDLKILNLLSKNARIPLIDIAKELKLDSMTIHHRIKKLEKLGIIQGYKVNLNFNLLKRDFYSVKINLNSLKEVKQIESYIKQIPETTAMTEAIGSYDIEFDLEVKDSEQYFKIIESLENQFSTIREIIYFRVLKSYKIIYMPVI